MFIWITEMCNTQEVCILWVLGSLYAKPLFPKPTLQSLEQDFPFKIVMKVDSCWRYIFTIHLVKMWVAGSLVQNQTGIPLNAYSYYGKWEFIPRCGFQEYLIVKSKNWCRKIWETGNHLTFVPLQRSLDSWYNPTVYGLCLWAKVAYPLTGGAFLIRPLERFS